jgi:hypothetical protein
VHPPEQEDYHEIFPMVEPISESWISSYLSWIKMEAEPIDALRIRRDIISSSNSPPPVNSTIFTSSSTSSESIEDIFLSSPGSQPEMETLSGKDSENEIDSKIILDHSTEIITEKGNGTDEDQIALEPTSILPGNIINAEKAHRIHIPNPRLNNGNPEELIRRLIRNRKRKHRIHPERDYNSSEGENLVCE